jgi:PAS domain S-box-containing protein
MMQQDATRMAIMTAASLLLLGCALFMRGQRGFAFGEQLILAAGALCLFNSIGYVYGIRSFYRLAFIPASTAMALPASVTFLILCAGALLSRPDRGLMSTITSPSPGGVMARRLLPAALLIPVAVGWLQWQGQLKRLYDTSFGLAWFTAVTVVIFAFVIWRSGQILNQLSAKRDRVERNIRQLADSMPHMVWAATPDGNLDYYNQHWYQYTGMNVEQTKDWGWKRVIHPDDLENTIAIWTEALRSCQPFDMEYRIQRASDGMYRWHRGQAHPIRNSEGAIERIRQTNPRSASGGFPTGRGKQRDFR